ncbi:DEAD/DEAH box helicase family protein [uncultured Clostridium sp.]|jgi:superfamily II DNA or RNA helicase|uniref:DEAD/DEAH box helicase family protein n=2 Tax=uncultured Clostridium sp. TaxID=59620 RepID=UPI002612157A|nr:DEAD/DEAH box helicase family protein [uncultured Clostridium sp.]
MENRKDILNLLKKLTYEKNVHFIKKELNSIEKLIKGKVFEEYLGFLFEGNGYIATISGGSHDGGADIILSRENNPNKSVWIIQAKNTIRPLGNADIITELLKFENQSSKKYNCKYFMIISLNGYVENVNMFNKTSMSLEDFEFIEELINNYKEKSSDGILLPDLRPHNRYTYKEVKAVLENKNRVAVPNATGTGKSFIILQILFDYRYKKSIVLAPTNEILDGLKKLAPWSITNCKFYTYSKFFALYSKGKLEELNIDLIILDEMHRAGALNWGKAVKYVLNKNNNSKIIGLSATPIRFLDNNRDMINELFYGSSTTPISLSEAIVRKILPMPIYVSAMYDLDKEIEKKLRLMKSLNISLEDKRKYIEELNVYKGKWERESKIENIIKKHLPKSKKLKFIIFCENNKHLIKMKDEVNKWFNSALDNKFNIKSFVITSINKRSKENLAKFESENNDNELKLLFAISKLNEGIHIRNITGIVMLRNTKSPSIYYQQLGRCLTTDSVDENPIVFDFVDNIDNLELVNFRKNLEEAKLFNNVYRRQIGLQDEDIRLCLYEEHEEVILELKNIERKTTYNWEESFESLLKFKEINGHLNVPKNDEYLRLYSWISLQRTLYKRNILNEEFISKLNSIGFIWDINIYKYKENYKKYEELIISSYEREISYYKLLNEKYYAVIYTKESLISKCEGKDILLEKEFIIRWWDKQIKDFQNNNLDDERKEIIIKEFRETSRFEENKWLISIYKIIKFYKKINECYRIDCYLNKIAPDKKRFINFVTSIYPSKKIIENTIEKNLPSSKKTRELEAYNEEYKAREFVKKLFLENSFIFDIKEYIDDINYIYFEDMIYI